MGRWHPRKPDRCRSLDRNCRRAQARHSEHTSANSMACGLYILDKEPVAFRTSDRDVLNLLTEKLQFSHYSLVVLNACQEIPINKKTFALTLENNVIFGAANTSVGP